MKLIIQKIFQDFRSFLIICLIILAGFIWIRGKLEIRSLSQVIAEFRRDFNGKFEHLENGVVKAERNDFLRYGSLYKLLNELPTSIKKNMTN